jgi:hypothetical protein
MPARRRAPEVKSAVFTRRCWPFRTEGAKRGTSLPGQRFTLWVQIDFDQRRACDPVLRELRDKANAIPTLWTITKENREVIEQAGTILLRTGQSLRPARGCWSDTIALPRVVGGGRRSPGIPPGSSGSEDPVPCYFGFAT